MTNRTKLNIASYLFLSHIMISRTRSNVFLDFTLGTIYFIGIIVPPYLCARENSIVLFFFNGTILGCSLLIVSRLLE
jgi:hypothetical protein